MLIFWKAYAVPDKELGNLKVPCDTYYSIIIKCYDVFEKQFKLHYTEKNIGLMLTKYIENEILTEFNDFWLIEECLNHREYIIKLFVRFHIFYFLKWMSRDHRNSGSNKRSCNSNQQKPCAKLQKLQK